MAQERAVAGGGGPSTPHEPEGADASRLEPQEPPQRDTFPVLRPDVSLLLLLFRAKYAAVLRKLRWDASFDDAVVEIEIATKQDAVAVRREALEILGAMMRRDFKNPGEAIAWLARLDRRMGAWSLSGLARQAFAASGVEDAIAANAIQTVQRWCAGSATQEDCERAAKRASGSWEPLRQAAALTARSVGSRTNIAPAANECSYVLKDALRLSPQAASKKAIELMAESLQSLPVLR